MIEFFIFLSLCFSCFIIFTLWGLFRKGSYLSDAKLDLVVLIPISGESIADLVAIHNTVIPSQSDVRVVFVLDDIFLCENEKKSIEDSALHSFIIPPRGTSGKKNVMRFAMEFLEVEWVLWMDADVIPNRDLFSSLPSFVKPDTKMVLIPLKPHGGKGPVRAFFDLDFLSLHAVGLGSAAQNMPLLCNAACLLVSREAFLNTAHLRNDWELNSGDDIFAMEAIKNHYGSVAIRPASLFLMPPQEVQFSNNPIDLWVQRFRWVAKSPQVNSFWFRLVALTILFSEISLIGMAVVIYDVPSVALPFGIFIIGQIVYLLIVSILLRRKDLLLFILPSIAIYPFYLLSLLLASFFIKPKWNRAENAKSVGA